MMKILLIFAAMTQAPQGCLSMPLPAVPAQAYIRAPGGPYDGTAWIVRLEEVPDAWHAFIREATSDDCGPGGWGPVVAVAELHNGRIWIPAAAVAGATGWVMETYDDAGRRLTVSAKQSFGAAQPCPSAYGMGDLDGDGIIGLMDFAVMQNSFGG